jgi:hypothetical protein
MSFTNIFGKNIYIKELPIGSWQYKLDNNVSYSNITNYPVVLINSDTSSNDNCNVFFETNISVSTTNHFFIFGSEKITIDGNNKILNIKIENLNQRVINGLFQNGTSTTSGFSNIEIKNLTLYNESNNKLFDFHGYFLQRHFGKNAINIKLNNLNNYGMISSPNSSGIGHIGETSSCEIINCTNYGQVGVTGTFGCGGILSGYSAKNNQGKILIENCKNFGDIYSNDSGGIVGRNCFVMLNVVEIKKCLNYGHMNNETCGGILGPFCVRDHSMQDFNPYVFKCHYCANYGDMNARLTSGIIGVNNFEKNSTFLGVTANPFIVSECYNQGKFNYYTQCSGIIGFYSLTNIILPDNIWYFLIVKNCYSYADIYSIDPSTNTSIEQTGIFGVPMSTPGAKASTSNCYSVTSINTENGIYYSSFSHIYTSNLVFEFNHVTTEWLSLDATLTLLGVAQQENSWQDYNLISSQVHWIETQVGLPFMLTKFNDIQFSDTSFQISQTGEIIIDDAQSSLNVQYEIISKNKDFFIYNHPSLKIKSNTPVGTYKIIISQISENNTYNHITITISVLAICLGENSILPTITNDMKIIYKKIKEISINDIIMTEYSGPKKIKYIYHEKIKNISNRHSRFKDKLYVLKKQDYPELKDDLILTGRHPILVNHNFSNKEIINNNHKFIRNFFRLETYKNKKAISFDIEGVFDIYNIVLENSFIGKNYPIRVNGILTETLSEYEYLLYQQKKTKNKLFI